MPVVDADLRDERENELFDRVEPEDESRDGRKNVRANKLQEPLGAGHQLKHSVGRAQKVLRVLKPLLVIRVEQSFVSLALHRKRHLPREIVAVRNPGVHPWRAAGECMCAASPARKHRPLPKLLTWRVWTL